MRDFSPLARFLSLGPRRAGLAAAFGVALLCSSCGPSDHVPVHPVHGQVLVDGRPASNALVVFHPLGDGPTRELRPVGHVGTDGTFILTTYARGDGAPAGDYAVTIDWRQPTPPVDGAEPGPSLLPARYNSPTASNLRVTVAQGQNDLQAFQLTRR